MSRTITKKIICLLVASLFLVNNLAYGLAPAPGTLDPAKQDEMFAAGRKLFAAKIGPGTIDFDDVTPRVFTPAIMPQVENVKVVKTSGTKSDLPKGWENNKLLEKTDLKEAFEYFRDNEARIPKELLSIEVGVFEVNDGELPIACIENRGGRYVLVLHKDFVRMWNDIRKNDVLFEYAFPDGETRTLSLAWGIFYRVAKHEMGDLNKHNPNLLPKSYGHFNYLPEAKEPLLLGKEYENKVNRIAGRYNIVNDAIWAWFLGSYCFANSTRYNNRILERRLNWFFDGDEAHRMHLDLEFPNLLRNPLEKRHAIQLALLYNYHFFLRGTEAVKAGLTPEDITETARYQAEYAARKSSITDTIYTTGAYSDDRIAAAARHAAIPLDIHLLKRDGGVHVNVGSDSKESSYENPAVRAEQDEIDRLHQRTIPSVHERLLRDVREGSVSLIGQETDKTVEELIARTVAWRAAGDKHTIILGNQMNASAEAVIGKLTGRTNWKTEHTYGVSRIHIVESYDPSSLEDLLKTITGAERDQTRIVVVGELDAMGKAFVDALHTVIPATVKKTEQQSGLFNGNNLPFLVAGLIDENAQDHIRAMHKGAAEKYQAWLKLDPKASGKKALDQYASYKMASTIARFAKSKQSLVIFWMYSTVFRYFSSWIAQIFNRAIGSADYNTMVSGEWVTQYWHSTMQAVRQAKGSDDELERYGFMSIVMLYPYQTKDAVIGHMANYQYRGFGFRFFLKVARAALETALRMAKRHFFGVDIMADTPEEIGAALFTFQMAALATGHLVENNPQLDHLVNLNSSISSNIGQNKPVQGVEDGKLRVRQDILTVSGEGNQMHLSGVLGNKIEAELAASERPTLNKVLNVLSLVPKRVQSKVIKPYRAGDAKEHLNPDVIRAEIAFAKAAAQLITNEANRLKQGKKSISKLYSMSIGGSTFGPVMTDALGLDEGPEIVELSSIDPEEMAKVISDIEKAEDPETIGLLVTSKSGVTPETDAVFSTIYEALIKCIAVSKNITEEEAEKIVAGQILIITDGQAGKLREMVKTKGLRSIDHPVLIGGRWSMFSSVGLIHYFLKGGSEKNLIKALDQMTPWDEELNNALKFIIVEKLESGTTIKDALNANKNVSIADRREVIRLVMEKLSAIPGVWEGVLANIINQVDNRDTEVVVGLSRPFEQLASHKNPAMAQIGAESLGKPGARYYRMGVYGWDGLRSIWNRLYKNQRAAVTFFHITASMQEVPSALRNADQAAYETAVRSLDAAGVPYMSVETGEMNIRNLLETMFFEYRRLAVMAALYSPMDVNDEGQIGVEQYKKVINSFLLRVTKEASEVVKGVPSKVAKILKMGTTIPEVRTDEIDTIAEAEMDLYRWIEPELADFLTSVIKGKEGVPGILNESTVRYIRALPTHEIPEFISNFLANPNLRQGSFYHKNVSKIYMDGKPPINVNPSTGEWIIVANSMDSYENLRSHGSNGFNFQVYRRLPQSGIGDLRWLVDVHVALGSDERVIISNGIITQDYRLKGEQDRKRSVEHDRPGESNRVIFSEVGKTLAPGGLSSTRPKGYQRYETDIQRALSTSYRFSDTPASDYNLILNKQGLFTGWLNWSEAVGMAYSAEAASGMAMFMSQEGMWHIVDNANRVLRESASQEGGVISQDQVYVYVGSPKSVRQIQVFMDYLIVSDDRSRPTVLNILDIFDSIPADANIALRGQILTWLLRLQEGIETIPVKSLSPDSELLKTINEIKTRTPGFLTKFKLNNVLTLLKDEYIKEDTAGRTARTDEFTLLGYKNALLRFDPQIDEGDQMKLVYNLEWRFLRTPSLKLLQLIASESMGQPWRQMIVKAISDLEITYRKNAERRTKEEQPTIPQYDFRKGLPISNYFRTAVGIPMEVRKKFGLTSNSMPAEAIAVYERIIDVYLNNQKIENIESDSDMMELRARRPEIFVEGPGGLYVRSLHEIRRLVEDDKYHPMVNASGDVSSLLDSIFNPIIIHFVRPLVSVIISEENKHVVHGSLSRSSDQPQLALFLDPIDGSSQVEAGGVFGMIGALAYLEPNQDLSKPTFRQTFNPRNQILGSFDMIYGFPRTILRFVNRAKTYSKGNIMRGEVAQFELLDIDEEPKEFRLGCILPAMSALEEGVDFYGFLPVRDGEHNKALGFAMGGALTEFMPERGHAELMRILQDDFGGYYLGYTGGLVSDIGKLLAMDRSKVHGIIHSYAATNAHRHGRFRYWFELLHYALMFDMLGGELSNGYESMLDMKPVESDVPDEPSGAESESIFASPWVSKFSIAFRTDFAKFYKSRVAETNIPSSQEMATWSRDFVELYAKNTQAMIDNLYNYMNSKAQGIAWRKKSIRCAFFAIPGNIYTNSYRLPNGEIVDFKSLALPNSDQAWIDNAEKIIELLYDKLGTMLAAEEEEKMAKAGGMDKLPDGKIPDFFALVPEVPGVVFEEAKPEDIPGVIDIFENVFKPAMAPTFRFDETQWKQNIAEKAKGRRSNILLMVARENGRVIGYAYAYQSNILSIHADQIAVSIDRQKRHIAARLTAAVLDTVVKTREKINIVSFEDFSKDEMAETEQHAFEKIAQRLKLTREPESNRYYINLQEDHEGVPLVDKPVASVPATTSAEEVSVVAGEHPLVTEIREIRLSHFTVPIGKDLGPGNIKLTPAEIRSFYGEIINLFHKDKIEIFLPQQIKLTEMMRTALSDIKKRDGIDIIQCHEFSSHKHLEDLLSRPLEKGVKRMIVTDTGSASGIAQLANARPAIFVGVRSLNVALPDGYDNAAAREKTFFQAKMIMEAILMRLYEKDKTPMLELMLTNMLRGNIEGNPLDFLRNSVESEDEATDPTKAARRIEYCLGKIISLVEKLAEDFEHMKLIMREFWTAA